MEWEEWDVLEYVIIIGDKKWFDIKCNILLEWGEWDELEYVIIIGVKEWFDIKCNIFIIITLKI